MRILIVCLLMVTNLSVWAKDCNNTASYLQAYAVTDTQFINLGVLVGQMKYNESELSVKAGSIVSIVFHNNDIMAHNILILNPGSKDKVGMAADKMMSQPDAMKKHYIPDTKEVLFHTPLVNPGKSFTLTFEVPDKKGDYPYICTFPGHWRIMQGVMKVE